MSYASSALAQVNVRVDPQVKRGAEETLRVAGGSISGLVRDVLTKVAGGAGELEKLTAVLTDAPMTAGQSPFEASWAAADSLCSSAVPDDRAWDEIYSEAMSAHFDEKGLFS